MMKRSILKSTSQSMVLGLAVISLAACGKNMHIPVGNEPTVKTVDGQSKNAQDKKQPTVQEPSDQKTSTQETASKQQSLVTDKLVPISKFDVQDVLKGNVKDIRHLGAPSMIANDIGINKNVTLVSRALILVPEAKQIKSIENFSVVLKGLTTLVADSEEQANEQICFGMDDKNCLDIAELSTKSVGELKDGVVKQAEGDVEINLIKDLKISEKSGDELKADVLAWVEKNTLPFSKNGIRKLIVRIRSNSNIVDSAVLFQIVSADSKSLDAVAIPAESDLVNGKSDIELPDALTPSEVVELSKSGETKQENVKKTEDVKTEDVKSEEKKSDDKKTEEVTVKTE